MKEKILFLFRATAIVAAGTAQLPADIVETRDGSKLVGKIREVTRELIRLETVYSGSIEVKRSEITGFSTEEPVVVRLASGTTISGRVNHKGESAVEIAGSNGALKTDLQSIVASWETDAEDPNVVKLREELQSKRRKWSYEFGIDLTGKQGNSDEFGTAARGKAEMKGPKDTLKFYGSYVMTEKDGDKTTNEKIGGIEYNSIIQGKKGWFVRSELESDEFEGIDLRITFAGGLSYQFYKQPKHSLLGKAGFSYRLERFDDGSNLDKPGLDFGLDHFLQFGEWGRLTTNLKFIPSVADLSDFRLSQDTGFEIPIAGSQVWRLRMGFSNFLNNNPSIGRDKLDTTYYTRVLFSWK